MEEYIREAPRAGSVSNKKLEYQEINLLPKPEELSAPESVKDSIEGEENLSDGTTEPPLGNSEVTPEPPQPADVDLLGLNEVNPDAVALEESNALALAIVPPGNETKRATGGFLEMGTSGWELALVATPSSNASHMVESKLAGGFDKLLLDSLYEDGEARRQQQQSVAYGVSSGSNPFELSDPFAMSNSIAPPPNVQMAQMVQQQQQQYQQQTMMMQPYQPYQQYQQYQPYQSQQLQQHIGSSNPFGDPFVGGFSQSTAPQGTQNLL